MFDKKKKVLILAPHTDDGELGCGGSIVRFIEDGSEVHVVAFSTAEQTLPPGSSADRLKREFLSAMPTLGVEPANLCALDFQVRSLSRSRQEILDELIRLKLLLNPDLVMCPSAHDVHQDHQVVHSEAIRAFKDVTLLAYEIPWNNISFSAEAFICLDQRHVALKWQALSLYTSQIELQRPYLNREFIESWARFRGVQVKAQFAEAFEVIRLRI
jgi:LmbE family N-acetylglucosaminyl deacetylase